MQWALTIGSCSGAQFHFHESAINVQIFGTYGLAVPHGDCGAQGRSLHALRSRVPARGTILLLAQRATSNACSCFAVGTKQWYLYPVGQSTSNKQMRSGHWHSKILPTLAPHEQPLTFSQGPGDIAVLPRYMTHSTMCNGECSSIFWVQSAFSERYVPHFARDSKRRRCCLALWSLWQCAQLVGRFWFCGQAKPCWALRRLYVVCSGAPIHARNWDASVSGADSEIRLAARQLACSRALSVEE